MLRVDRGQRLDVLAVDVGAGAHLGRAEHASEPPADGRDGVERGHVGAERGIDGVAWPGRGRRLSSVSVPTPALLTVIVYGPPTRRPRAV